MSKSWQAADKASELKNIDYEQYYRLINAIASDLENQGLFYEAVRLKTRIGITLPNDYPFKGSFEIHPDWLHNPNLVPLLYKLVKDKIINY